MYSSRDRIRQAEVRETNVVEQIEEVSRDLQLCPILQLNTLPKRRVSVDE
jgi:hypothetical protein